MKSTTELINNIKKIIENDTLSIDYCEHDDILHIKKIFVKAPVSGWHEVSKEQAKKFILHLLNGMTAITKEKRLEYIETNYLMGTTIKELLED